jgi:hypothetical protein
MEYKWSIDKLTVTENSLVTQVHWRVTATEGDLTASAVGVRHLVRGDGSVPYEQLTEQQVLGWCFEPEVIAIPNTTGTVEKHLKQDGERQVANQIERQLAQQATEPALPWQAAQAMPTLQG